MNTPGDCTDMRLLHAQLLEASFGATVSATINVYTRNWIRTLSATGPGIVTNYWTDGNSAFNNYGNGYQSALQSMNLGSLRYPGGEKSDACGPALRHLCRCMSHQLSKHKACYCPAAASPAHSALTAPGCERVLVTHNGIERTMPAPQNEVKCSSWK